jgi:cell fate regulator YaaT (PSP1 superfamily)
MTIQDELVETFPATIRIAAVKVRDRGEVKKVGAADATLRVGDRVMLEADGEPTYGVVYGEPQAMPFYPPMRVMKTILRKATLEDLGTIERYERLAQEGMAVCRERIHAQGIEMKLVEVYCSFQRREMTFIYTAPERVDFRQLVRELARRFGGRIEMLQIGEREEAKRLGGVDSCGLVLCCTAFMTDFKPVSVKKAKAQGLPMDESRLIGVCGRLKCCLMFELQESQTATGSPATSALINPTRLSESANQLGDARGSFS